MTEPHLVKTTITLNGQPETFHTAPDTRLIDVLRENMGLTAAKQGCSIGRCGACVVIMNGLPVNACLVMAWQVDGARINTPEALNESKTAQIVRKTLTEENAFQCGYCAPGFTISLTALFERNPDAGEDDIRKALSGHLCRCTGYQSILRGAMQASQALKGANP